MYSEYEKGHVNAWFLTPTPTTTPKTSLKPALKPNSINNKNFTFLLRFKRKHYNLNNKEKFTQ